MDNKRKQQLQILLDNFDYEAFFNNQLPKEDELESETPTTITHIDPDKIYSWSKCKY